MVTGRHILPLVVSLLVGVHGHAAESPETAQARKLWAQSPHGRMLERILPPAVEPQQLPEPHTDGARLMSRYCV